MPEIGFFILGRKLRIERNSGCIFPQLPLFEGVGPFWQSTQLEWLRLDLTEIDEICEDIGNLSHLQFLHLYQCKKLKSLPSQMGELKNLKYLEMWFCDRSLVTDNLRSKLPNCKIVMRD